MQTESNHGQNSQTAAISEIEEDLIVRQQRRHIFPRAVLVGVGAGLVAALFRATLTAADSLRGALVVWSHSMPVLGWVFPALFSALGGHCFCGARAPISRRRPGAAASRILRV